MRAGKLYDYRKPILYYGRPKHEADMERNITRWFKLQW